MTLAEIEARHAGISAANLGMLSDDAQRCQEDRSQLIKWVKRLKLIVEQYPIEMSDAANRELFAEIEGGN